MRDFQEQYYQAMHVLCDGVFVVISLNTMYNKTIFGFNFRSHPPPPPLRGIYNNLTPHCYFNMYVHC